VGATALLRSNMAIYGLSGLAVSVVGINHIDLDLVSMHLPKPRQIANPFRSVNTTQGVDRKQLDD